MITKDQMMIKYRDKILLWGVLALATLAVSTLKAQTVTGGSGATAPTEIYKLPSDGQAERVHSSQYDYAAVASRLTAGCTDNYSKYKAIYEWMCDSIDYDLTHSIHRADSCYMIRMGVCQGYCELFSWGAGSYEDGRYVKNRDKWAWFNVEPEWMLLSHFPEHEHYQLTNRHLTRDEFLAMPVVNPLFRTYGISTHQLFQMAVEHRLTMPKFYNLGEGVFKLIDIPMCTSLKIGQNYQFRVKMNNQRNFGIVNKPVLCRKKEWTDEGNGVYSLSFMPRATGKVVFSLIDPADTTSWYSMVEYAVEPPTADDWAKVERDYPLNVPDATKVGKIDAEGWRRCGINGHTLLAMIREQHIEALPSVYHDRGQEFDIISVPMNRKLKAGKPYTFSIRPKSGIKWAIVADNNKYWTSLVYDVE